MHISIARQGLQNNDNDHNNRGRRRKDASEARPGLPNHVFIDSARNHCSYATSSTLPVNSASRWSSSPPLPL